MRGMVDQSRFAAVPRPDVPRARFSMTRNLKTAFNASYLIPIMCEEVLPGDTVRTTVSSFVRLATPIFPVMDNIYCDFHFFYVPNRLLWTNWKKFMGEQDDPDDSISYTLPVMGAVDGWPIGSLGDYFGLPTEGQVIAGGSVSHHSLPLRAYNLIWKEWYRDQNLQDSPVINTDDGPDAEADFPLRKRGKRHDYFTSCLPWPQKGNTAVSLPLGTSAVVRTSASDLITGNAQIERYRFAAGGAVASNSQYAGFGNSDGSLMTAGAGAGAGAGVYPANLYADLSTATAATINQLRQAFQVQKLLERDARGGTRYNEMVLAHFGVRPPDFRVQRPEYLGGGTAQVGINSVPQTSATDLTGSDTPQGNLSAFGVMSKSGIGFAQSFTEHGYIIGLISVRADLTYQQGLRRHWSRSTRYDFYFPAFAHLGEQAVLNKEIYAVGNNGTTDNEVFGYQERWAELRYSPSEITGLMRSTAASTIHAWHLAQDFASLPELDSTFIEENVPLERVLAVGASANGQQLIGDFYFQMQWVRPIPIYSVPGLIDHF